ncbi:hypothetical protein C8R46DRAFT_1208098 [Mycena filopes]|nr:hypothetical protein C8R46DRAFT_1208098 [Mycena filopes]
MSLPPPYCSLSPKPTVVSANLNEGSGRSPPAFYLNSAPPSEESLPAYTLPEANLDRERVEDPFFDEEPLDPRSCAILVACGLFFWPIVV